MIQEAMRPALCLCMGFIILAGTAQAQDLVAPRVKSLPGIEVPSGVGVPEAGVVRVQVRIDPDGTGVVESCDAERVLCDLVANAVRRAEFAPATRDGNPVPSQVAVDLKVRKPTVDEPAGGTVLEPAAAAVEKELVFSETVEVDASARASIKLELDGIRNIPGTFGEPFRTLELMPGTVPVANGQPYVYVRGAPPSGTVYVYDDIAIPLLFHSALGPATVQPGLIGGIYDGVQRPLDVLRAESGDFVSKGVHMEALGRDRSWHFSPAVQTGDHAHPGMIIGTVRETDLIEHRILVPPRLDGKLVDIVAEGEYTVEDVVARVDTGGETAEMKMYQKWPVRVGRPYGRRRPHTIPLITGQRVLDTLFPVARGGVVVVPGGFGTGKTMIQHALAKWCDADVVVYIGCGERGNEMTEVLLDFPKLTDPRTGKFLMERTILIANTSNMPVAAREASIYTGITIAEYYRDMGYHVAVMADSTSRWAEALRELSGRMEEMPADEGFPAYLPTRLAEFYERAGVVDTLSGSEGSITTIGAVSPPGGDFS